MSIADLQRRLLSLETDVARLRHEVPVRLGFSSVAPVSIIIIGGQSLGTFNSITTYGIEKYAGTLGSVTTTTYDPGTVDETDGTETGGPSPAITAWPSGLGYGTMIENGVYSRVIVVNDSRGGCSNVLVGGASDDTTYAPSVRQVTILSTRMVTVTKADATTIDCYSPDLG